jgi:hypothetical protein
MSGSIPYASKSDSRECPLKQSQRRSQLEAVVSPSSYFYFRGTGVAVEIFRFQILNSCLRSIVGPCMDGMRFEI